MNKILAWILGSLLTIAGTCLINDWRTLAGIALVLLGGLCFRNVTIKDKNWVE